MPRTKFVRAVLEAILGQGTGPHLSRYFLYCPVPPAGIPSPTPALSFLIWLYHLGLNQENILVDGQVGREAVLALIEAQGAMAQILPRLEQAWSNNIREGTKTVGDLFAHLHRQYSIGKHYEITVKNGNPSEELHRAVISSEMLTEMPWEVTRAWLLGEKWYERADAATATALARFVKASFEFGPAHRAAFLNKVEIERVLTREALGSSAPEAAVMRMLRAARAGKFTDETILQACPPEAIITRVDRRLVASYLDYILDWLGEDEVEIEIGKVDIATSRRE